MFSPKKLDTPADNHQPAVNTDAQNVVHVMRRRAEDVARARLAQLPASPQALSAETMEQVMHELQVHQIELEMQNDELRQAQVALDAARSSYFDLFDLAPMSYCTVSEQGLILEANFAAATLFGVTRGALVRQRLSKFIVKADQDVYYRCRTQMLASGETQHCELQMRKHDDTFFWAHLVVTAAQDSAGAPVLRVMASDISERKRLDNTLQEKNLALEVARQAADKANLAKSDFLSSMSHELRSPLNAILGFAQLLESGSPLPTPVQKSSIDQILHGGWYLLELINEILDLALVESGKLSLSLEPVSLAEKLRDCQSMIEPLAEKNGIRVSFAELEDPFFVYGDRTRIKQILINLLSNAIKYNRAGGTVRVTCRPISAERIRINVQDEGDGLPPEKLSQLFQPFNRLGQESGAKEGTGIGLVVCKRLVEMMGGTIGVASTVGNGSVFWIELNLVAAPELAGGSLENYEQVLHESGGALRTLLYIEDNRANMQLVEQLIARRPDMRLLGAEDGMSGIMLARTQQPQVILMDVNLPGINGIQAMKLLREDPATQHIPVLAISANAMPHDIEKGLAAGFFRYLTKPIKIDEFMVALDLALKVVPPSGDEANNESVLL